MLFGKNKGFCKKKMPSRDKTRPAFTKERLIAQPNARRKIVAATHHHELRSPQKKRQKPVTEDEEEDGKDIQPSAIEVETVSPCIISSTVAEPLSSQSVSLFAQEVMPRELRSTKDTNDVGKNGKMASDFMIRRLSGGPLQNPEGLKKL